MQGPGNNWIEIAALNPRDRPGSISDNKPDGGRDVYLFECEPDDSKSTIYQYRGSDTEFGLVRLVDLEGIEVVKELRRGDKPYEMRVKPGKVPEHTQIRFTHR